MSQPLERGISIFSSRTAPNQDRETGLEPSTASSSGSEGDMSEASSSELGTDSEGSSSPFRESTDAESSSDSEHNGDPSDDPSDSEDSLDVSDNDSVSHGDASLKRDDPKAAVWLRKTAEERAICDGMDRDDDTNLTKHIVNSHGFYANQYSPNDKERKPVNRGLWISGWRPPAHWTAWPMPPALVPRRPYRVWDSSIMMNERWVPSRDLESELFAYMLKQSRLRWKRKVGESLMMKNELGSRHSKTYSPDRKPGEDRKRKFDEIPINQPTGNNAENDDIVVSADDDKSWAVAKPVVRSILTDFDSVLSALQSSADKAHRTHHEIRTFDPEGKPVPKLSKKDQPRTVDSNIRGGKRHARTKPPTRYNLLDRDWSHVLAMASIAGISPRVISRAAVRCSAVFNETMKFQSVPEQDADTGLTNPVTFQPSDLREKSSDRRFEQPPMTWDVSEGCPFPDCRWFHRQGFPSQIVLHMKNAHKWDPLPFDRDFKTAITGMVGGVHVDGFLQPVPPKNVRGKDKNEGPNQTRAAYMKRRWDKRLHRSEDARQP
jgi:hypothetical protein